MDTSTHLCAARASLTATPDEKFDGQLRMFFMRLIDASIAYIVSQLTFSRSFNGAYVHYASCMMLDPLYSNFYVLQGFSTANVTADIASKVQGYSKLLIVMLYECTSHTSGRSE